MLVSFNDGSLVLTLILGAVVDLLFLFAGLVASDIDWTAAFAASVAAYMIALVITHACSSFLSSPC